MKNLFSILFYFNLLIYSAFGQRIDVNLSISNSTPGVKEVIEFTIQSNVKGVVELQLPRDFTSASVITGMTRQSSNNINSTIFYKKEQGFFTTEGQYTIGPAKIKVGNKIYLSNKLVVSVKNSNANSKTNVSSKNLSDRIVFGLIEINKTSVYIGEPILVNSRAYSQFEPKSFVDYREYSSKGIADKHKLPNPDITNVEVKKYQNKRYYSFIYDKSICFPNAAGTYTIEAFQLTLGNFFDQERIISETAAIHVKDLPSDRPSTFSGAVGKMNVERILKKNAKKQGDVAIVSFEFSGYGNLHSIELPELKLPVGLQLYGDPTIREDFQFTEKGAEGKLIIDYNIQMLDPGEQKIPDFVFSYFDLETEKYISLTVDSILFSVEKTPGFDKIKAQNEALKRLTKKKNKQVIENSWIDRSFTWILIILLIITILIFVLFLFRKKNRSEAHTDDKVILKEEIVESTQKNSIKKIYQIDLKGIEMLVNSPTDYIIKLELEMNNWISSHISEDKQLSRFEKVNYLSEKNEMKDKILLINEIFRNIDEAKYGLIVDENYCKKIQEKLNMLFKN
jgi:hypothetical protein